MFTFVIFPLFSASILRLFLGKGVRYSPRVGVINDCPQKDLFHDPCDVIIMSRMAISEVVILANVMIVIIYVSEVSTSTISSR